MGNDALRKTRSAERLVKYGFPIFKYLQKLCFHLHEWYRLGKITAELSGLIESQITLNSS